MNVRRLPDIAGRALVAAVLVGGGVLPLVGVQAASAQDADFLFDKPRLTLSLHGGFNRADAGSDVFAFTTDELTVEQRDFDAFALRGELAIRVSDRFDIAIDVGRVSTTIQSENRDFIGTDDLPIFQQTEFTQIPFAINGKYYLLPRGRQIGRFAWIPASFSAYVGGGVGGVSYDWVQSGEFVIEETLAIVPARLESGGTGGLVQLFAGLEVPLGSRFLLALDGRYRWADAIMTRDWSAFDNIDLSGLSGTVGLAVRF